MTKTTQGIKAEDIESNDKSVKADPDAPTMKYVFGTIRKDAVEITPVEVTVPEAKVLEQLWNDGFVVIEIRERKNPVPSAQNELDRLTRRYGAEIVAQTFGAAAVSKAAVKSLLDQSVDDVAEDMATEPDADEETSDASTSAVKVVKVKAPATKKGK